MTNEIFHLSTLDWVEVDTSPVIPHLTTVTTNHEAPIINPITKAVSILQLLGRRAIVIPPQPVPINRPKKPIGKQCFFLSQRAIRLRKAPHLLVLLHLHKLSIFKGDGGLFLGFLDWN
jgi:hypothetical protein